MKFFWRIFIPVFMLSLGVWYVLDSTSRYNFSFKCPNPQDVRIFNKDTISDTQLHYQKYFEQERYRFPRDSVFHIKIRRNVPLISFLTEKDLSVTSQKALLKFLNNPQNFSWRSNEMLYKQADYILYFYNKEHRLIGKLWLCLSCHLLKAVPFTPNIKFGRVKEAKMRELLQMIF